MILPYFNEHITQFFFVIYLKGYKWIVGRKIPEKGRAELKVIAELNGAVGLGNSGSGSSAMLYGHSMYPKIAYISISIVCIS